MFPKRKFDFPSNEGKGAEGGTFTVTDDLNPRGPIQATSYLQSFSRLAPYLSSMMWLGYLGIIFGTGQRYLIF